MEIQVGAKRVSRRSLLGNYLLRKYENVFASIDHVSAPDENEKLLSNRDLVQGIASSLFDATWERLKAMRDDDTKTIDDDFQEYMSGIDLESNDSFWKDENFRQEYEARSASSEDPGPQGIRMERIQNGQFKNGRHLVEETKEHFVDMVIDRLILSLLPDELPEREQFSQRVSEPSRRKSQTVSVSIMSRNIRILTSKLGAIFEVQDELVRLATWRNPAGTLLILVVFTKICFNPMLLLILPIVYIMFGLMIPGYLHRHPLHRGIYLSKRSYGQSLIKDITTGGSRVKVQPHEPLREYSYEDVDLDALKKANAVRQSMEFVVNLRDLQNLMSIMVFITDKVEKFVYGTAGFKNEQISTMVFLSGFFFLISLWVIAPFINWALMTSMLAWGVMFVLHPRVRPVLLGLLKKQQLEKGKEVLEKTERYDILLDEPVETRWTEVFEIQIQGITETEWSHYMYATHVFDKSDPYRKSQKPPPGVQTLEELKAPPTWVFDSNCEWITDTNVQQWAAERGLENLRIDGDYLVDDQFKRKRLIRKVIRYANPARIPSYR
ncbi:Peroxisomal membrane protein PEX28 [Kluyveromyces marxianus]